MRRNKKNQSHEITDCLPLFKKQTSIKDDAPVSPLRNSVVSSAEVISFHTAAEMRKKAAQVSLEKNALESILERAKKLNW
jgi:hypothetical protein